jgi:hypothetical protein
VLDREARIGYKKKCRCGGPRREIKKRPLDSGKKLPIILSRKICSLKTK